MHNGGGSNVHFFHYPLDIEISKVDIAPSPWCDDNNCQFKCPRPSGTVWTNNYIIVSPTRTAPW